MMKKILFSSKLFSLCLSSAFAGTPKELKYDLNESGSNYIKVNLWTQAWIRYNNNNPGSLVNGTPEHQTFDVGLRRTRIQVASQISDIAYFYTQVGVNNLAYNSTRKQGLFFHDIVGEFKVVNTFLNLGTGLTGFSGLSRYAAPSSTSILSMDVPLYQQVDNDVNDQFGRNLSIYAKGKLEKLDYRLIVSKPMSIPNGTLGQSPIAQQTSFAQTNEKIKVHGYFNYQFQDQESNLNPYFAGTYLGNKKIFNLGLGFMHQKNAMWAQSATLDTIYYTMNLINADIFFEKPFSSIHKNTLTFYGAVSYYDMGPKYYRNIGPMNPTNGISTSAASINGTGNGAPIIGTGTHLYGQVSYLFKRNLFGKLGTIQPYYTQQRSMLKAFEKPVNLIDIGCNWLINGQHSKITLNYQSRPIFEKNANSLPNISNHKGTVTLQVQMFL